MAADAINKNKNPEWKDTFAQELQIQFNAFAKHFIYSSKGKNLNSFTYQFTHKSKVNARRTDYYLNLLKGNKCDFDIH